MGVRGALDKGGTPSLIVEEKENRQKDTMSSDATSYDPAAQRESWAAEERDRRAFAERISRAAKKNAGGSRAVARARFSTIRTVMADMCRVYEEQEYRRDQREREERRRQEEEQVIAHDEGGWMGTAHRAAGPGHPPHRPLSAAEEKSNFVPSLTKLLTGEFDHPAASERHVKRLIGAIWHAVNNQ